MYYDCRSVCSRPSRSGCFRCLCSVKTLYFSLRNRLTLASMGCIQSRQDISDIHPNIFRVIHLDELRQGLWHGQIEVTEMELVLYRRGREATKWPLSSLRRYGFEGDVFSFESGRRCTTGQGIYSFRCRRAEQLFTTLQQYIQVRNLSMDEASLGQSSNLSSLSGPATAQRPPLAARQVQRADSLPSQTTASAMSINIQNTAGPTDYLEPMRAISLNRDISRFSGTIRLNSLSSGPISPDINSPGSPSSANILEVMPLNPLPEVGTNHVSNLYQLQEFPLREHNNNRKMPAEHSYTNTNGIVEHSYTNTNDVHSDLAKLRGTLLVQHSTPESNKNVAHSSTANPSTLSNISEYATLVEKDPLRLYMNVGAGNTTPISSNCESQYENTILSNNEAQYENTQILSKHIYTNDSRCIEAYKVVEVDEEKHSYANLNLNEVNYDPKMLGRQISRNAKCFIFVESDIRDYVDDQPSTVEQSNPLNYAVLDLGRLKEEKNEEATNAVQTLPPESPKMAQLGYTTIDFNKTVALNSMSACVELDTEGSRRTRHNSTALPIPSTSGL